MVLAYTLGWFSRLRVSWIKFGGFLMNEVLRLIELLASSVFDLASKQQIELDSKRAFLSELERVKSIFDPSCIYINTLGNTKGNTLGKETLGNTLGDNLSNTLNNPSSTTRKVRDRGMGEGEGNTSDYFLHSLSQGCEQAVNSFVDGFKDGSFVDAKQFSDCSYMDAKEELTAQSTSLSLDAKQAKVEVVETKSHLDSGSAVKRSLFNEIKEGFDSLSESQVQSINQKALFPEMEAKSVNVAVEIQSQKPKPKTKKPRITGFKQSTRDLVNELFELWPKVRDGKRIPNDAVATGARIEQILEEYPEINNDLLREAALSYLEMRPEYPNAIQFWFGPGKPGRMPPWEVEVRGLLTRKGL
jgi:hypothetical protein